MIQKVKTVTVLSGDYQVPDTHTNSGGPVSVEKARPIFVQVDDSRRS
jgi:hypothetical protein